MRLVRGIRVALALAGLCAYVSAHGAAAPEGSTYPTKPVRMIVPFAPGGTNDILGRMIATELGARLGRTFIVDNRPGGRWRHRHRICHEGESGRLYLDRFIRRLRHESRRSQAAL